MDDASRYGLAAVALRVAVLENTAFLRIEASAKFARKRSVILAIPANLTPTYLS
jgi:hypothetical protein